MVKLSIVIPVFNAERYLDRCLSAILNYRNSLYEIILIEDNSSDNSLTICKKIQNKFPNKIKLFRLVNAGAGAARNLGVAEASGDYIWFIDSDDFIAQDAIPKLLNVLSNSKPDLIMFGAERRFQDGNRIYIPAVSPVEPGFKHRFIRSGPGPWQFLIRKDWWVKCGFKFYEGIIHEDMELLPIIILYAKNFTAIDEPLYFYCENPKSVLHTAALSKRCFDIFTALENLYARFLCAKAEKIYADDLEWFFIWNLLLDSARDFKKFKDGSFGILESRKILNTYFPNWRKNPYLKKSPIKIQARVYFNYYRRPKM